MKFQTHNDSPSINVQGCGMQGTIQASKLELIAAFGEPSGDGDEGKVTMRWEIQFADGTVATIYDWKRLAQPEPGAVASWNIGGHVQAAVWAVHDAFREAHGLLAKARVA